MTSPAPKLTTKGSARWTREEVFKLLCALNLNIAEISPKKDQPKDDEMRAVILGATTLLSRSMTPEGSASRLENKLAALWKEFGDPNGDKKPYALYQYGAFIKTLPGLEDPKRGFPGMLNEIAEKVRTQQMSQVPVARSIPESQRRSQRTTVRDASRDPVVCRCGFTQNIACIHCDHCFTWQHAICYYGTEVDEDLPKAHGCDNCLDLNTLTINPGEDNSLVHLVHTFGRASIHVSTNQPSSPTQRVPTISNLAQGCNRLGPFGLPRDGSFFWGPADGDIASTMERLTSAIRQVVHSLLNVGVSVPRMKKVLAHKGDLDPSRLLEAAHGPTFQTDLQRLVSQPVRPVAKIARMFMGLISAIVVDLVFNLERRRSKSVDEMLYHHLCRNVLDMNGPQVLRDLRRKTLLSLLEKSHHQFAKLAADLADALADQLLRLLREMLPSTSGTAKHLATEAAILPWRKILADAFAMCLKLKTQLALSERLYELYTPSIGSAVSMGSMVDVRGEEIAPGQSIEICLMPAVVEYEAKDLGMDFDNFLLLSAEEIFVTPQPAKRSIGNVVSPAIVALAPVEHVRMPT